MGKWYDMMFVRCEGNVVKQSSLVFGLFAIVFVVSMIFQVLLLKAVWRQLIILHALRHHAYLDRKSRGEASVDGSEKSSLLSSEALDEHDQTGSFNYIKIDGHVSHHFLRRSRSIR